MTGAPAPAAAAAAAAALEELDGLFRGAGWTHARRIEVRGGYASDRQDPRWARWQTTRRVEPDPDRPWYTPVRQLRNEGRAIRRVRVVDTPPTRGQLYLRAVARAGNIPAGEAIRELGRTRAQALWLDQDVWLFDGPRPVIAMLYFSTLDDLLGITVSRAPSDIAAARHRWQAAWRATAEQT